MGDLGWPIHKSQLKFIVLTFIKEMDIRSSFKENMPGDQWLNLFQKCCQHRLSQRKPDYVMVVHSKDLSEKVLNGLFMMLENLLDTLGIKDMPERFFNLDETGLSLDPKKKMPFIIEAQRMHRWYFLQKGKPCTLLFLW